MPIDCGVRSVALRFGMIELIPCRRFGFESSHARIDAMPVNFQYGGGMLRLVSEVQRKDLPALVRLVSHGLFSRERS